MPRTARIVAPGVPHHVTQRGNNRQQVFFADEDRRAYLKILAQQAARYGVKILGYCLMDNHVHLITLPEREDSLAKAIGRTHWLYSQYVNRRRHRSGHLWQNRFYSNAMDEAHCLLAMRYVERNPLRAGMCRVARRYAWSSAAAHCGQKDSTGLLDAKLWQEICVELDWEGELALELTEPQLSRLRRSWHTGRPLAGEGFIRRLERALGRGLCALPVGRPRKKSSAKKGGVK